MHSSAELKTKHLETDPHRDGLTSASFEAGGKPSKINDLPERDSAEGYPALRNKTGALRGHPGTCVICMIVASSKMGMTTRSLVLEA